VLAGAPGLLELLQHLLLQSRLLLPGWVVLQPGAHPLGLVLQPAGCRHLRCPAGPSQHEHLMQGKGGDWGCRCECE
jgi:hypothetical protein